MANTMSKYGSNTNRPLSEIVGLSTDTKPTDSIEGIKIQNGSSFRELDTGKRFLFDAENTTWNEVSSGGGGGGSTLIEKSISANGVYNASDDSADGYSKVTVDVPSGGEYIYYPVELSIGAKKDIPNYIVICRRRNRFMIIGSYMANVTATQLVLKYPDDLEIGTLSKISGFVNVFYSHVKVQERSLNALSVDTQARTITLTPERELESNAHWILGIELNETFT